MEHYKRSQSSSPYFVQARPIQPQFCAISQRPQAQSSSLLAFHLRTNPQNSMMDPSRKLIPASLAEIAPKCHSIAQQTPSPRLRHALDRYHFGRSMQLRPANLPSTLSRHAPRSLASRLQLNHPPSDKPYLRRRPFFPASCSTSARRTPCASPDPARHSQHDPERASCPLADAPINSVRLPESITLVFDRQHDATPPVTRTREVTTP